MERTNQQDRAIETSDKTRSVDALSTGPRATRDFEVALGAALIVLGLLAILVPSLMTVVGTLFLGGILLAGGIVHFIQAVQERGSPKSGWELLTGLLAVVAGGLLVLFPAVGMLTLTMLLGSFFVVVGIVKVIRSVQLRRDMPRWGWLLLSGIVTVVLGGILLAHLPGTATWALGLIIGIQLVVEGISLLGGATPNLRLTSTS